MLALLATSTLFASDITTRDGTTYKHAEVTGVDADGPRITHSTGVTKIPFDNLPDALQKEYGYNPAKVAAYNKAVEEAKKAETARAAAAREQAASQAQQEAEKQRRQAQERADSEQRKAWLEQTGTVAAVIVGIAFARMDHFEHLQGLKLIGTWKMVSRDSIRNHVSKSLSELHRSLPGETPPKDAIGQPFSRRSTKSKGISTCRTWASATSALFRGHRIAHLTSTEKLRPATLYSK
jgi:hypothetical protein